MKEIEIDCNDVMKEIYGYIDKLEELSKIKFSFYEKVFTNKMIKNQMDKLQLMAEIVGYSKLGFKLGIMDRNDERLREFQNILDMESR